MVERLKQALDKAREQRGDAPVAPAAQPGRRGSQRPAVWSQLEMVETDVAQMRRERLVAIDRDCNASTAFDALRTRMLKMCGDRSWTRIGIVSPGKACGKSLICANLSISIARQKDLDLVVMDCDLRSPRLATIFGVKGERRFGDYLRGDAPIERAFVRIAENLTLGLNTHREPFAAELMQSTQAGRAVATAAAALAPRIMLIDLPPLLLVDDASGFLPNLDAVLLIAAAGKTTKREIEDCERLLTNNTGFLGVVLNRYEGPLSEPYLYGTE